MNRFFDKCLNKVMFSAKHSEEQLIYITCGFCAFGLVFFVVLMQLHCWNLAISMYEHITTLTLKLAGCFAKHIQAMGGSLNPPPKNFETSNN